MKQLHGLLFFVSFSMSAVADDGSSPLARCRDMTSYGAAGGCAAEVAKDADKKLNAVYKTLKGKLQAPEIEKLRNAQRKWIAYKEADCDFSSPLTTMPPDVKEASDRAYCVAEKTLARLKELQDIIDWPVGCNGCPF